MSFFVLITGEHTMALASADRRYTAGQVVMSGLHRRQNKHGQPCMADPMFVVQFTYELDALMTMTPSVGGPPEYVRTDWSRTFQLAKKMGCGFDEKQKHDPLEREALGRARIPSSAQHHHDEPALPFDEEEEEDNDNTPPP